MALKNLYFKNKASVLTVEQFWDLFLKRESDYYTKLKEDHKNAESILKEILNEVHNYHSTINGLIGFSEDDKLELIFTADCLVKDFVFAKELVEKAPVLKNWKFHWLKPDSNNFEFTIAWADFRISKEKLWFYPNTDNSYPDEICINLVYEDFTKEENYDEILNGVLIFLDNSIGELNMATKIDQWDLVFKDSIPSSIELIPIEKINEYINWREKEFLQKYDKYSYPLVGEEGYSVLEAEYEDLPISALINRDWKDWPYKSVYSWCIKLELNFKGNEFGFPLKEQLIEIQNFEDEIIKALLSLKLCHIGRTIYNNSSSIYFYSNEYLLVSKMIHEFLLNAEISLDINYFISRDKYWRNVEEYF